MNLLQTFVGVFGVVVIEIAAVCIVFGVVAGLIWLVAQRKRKDRIVEVLKRHFKPSSLKSLSITERQFPFHIRADLHQAVVDSLNDASIRLFTGLAGAATCSTEGIDFSDLLKDNFVGGSPMIAPPQYEQIDIGEEEPLSTLKNGLWLVERDGVRCAILFAPASSFAGCGYHSRLKIQIATLDHDRGIGVAESFFRQLETYVTKARCYRGKILSLDSDESYYGHSTGVKVHRLSGLSREDIILPQKTLDQLDRNIVEFVKNRPRLSEFRMAIKKGLLFYGPPGTGKTFTIRYLARSLEGHTTLLISAEQVGLLGEYVTLARFLQPSIIIIEDVDLIARDRASMRDVHSEILLNKLLNEMDGLKEDCEILFILTTNRPEELEAALASRPGRIDQAIEFPLPNAEGRAKLARLYSRGMNVTDDVIEDIVQRTEGVSASFIKELMRRSAQFQISQNGASVLTVDAVKYALEEMLFTGGLLNRKLIGAGLMSQRDDG